MPERKKLIEQLVKKDSSAAEEGELLAPYLGELTEENKEELNDAIRNGFKSQESRVYQSKN